MGIREEVNVLFSRYESGQIGKEALFDSFYCSFYEKLKAICQSFVHDSESAEDMASESIMKAYREFDSNAPRMRNFASWIYTIAKNTCLTEAKRRRRWKPVCIEPCEDEKYFTPSVGDDPLPAIEAHEIAEAAAGAMRESMGSTTPNSRRRGALAGYMEAFEAHYMRGIRDEDFALMRGINIGTAKSRASRGKELVMKRLRPLVDEYRAV